MRLTEANLLHDLKQPEHAALCRVFVPMVFPKGQVVFQPQAQPDRIFIVSRGRARVYLAARDKELTVAVLDDGDVYTTHTRAYVQALDELELLVADLSAVAPWLATVPSLTSSMVRVLGGLLAHCFTVINNLAFKDVRKRLIGFLAYEASRTPSGQERLDGGSEGIISLGLNTETLATIIGSTRQTVSSLLNALAAEGVIQLRGRGVICIPDMELLAALSAD